MPNSTDSKYRQQELISCCQGTIISAESFLLAVYHAVTFSHPHRLARDAGGGCGRISFALAGWLANRTHSISLLGISKLHRYLAAPQVPAVSTMVFLAGLRHVNDLAFDFLLVFLRLCLVPVLATRLLWLRAATSRCGWIAGVIFCLVVNVISATLAVVMPSTAVGATAAGLWRRYANQGDAES
jgi:hypothetical protein